MESFFFPGSSLCRLPQCLLLLGILHQFDFHSLVKSMDIASDSVKMGYRTPETVGSKFSQHYIIRGALVDLS